MSHAELNKYCHLTETLRQLPYSCAGLRPTIVSYQREELDSYITVFRTTAIRPDQQCR